MKTELVDIEISEEIFDYLQRCKSAWGCKDIDEVINIMIGEAVLDREGD